MTTPQREFSRRDFIHRGGLALGVGVLGAWDFEGAPAQAAPPSRVWIGSQLYGWGQYYERMGKNLTDHLDEVLSAIRDCGYDYVEGWFDANQPENNGRFADRLRAKGLQPVSLYTGGRLHEEGKANETVEKLLAAAGVCQKAGFRVINCNPDPIGREKTDAELAVQAAALTQFGSGLKKLGLRLGVHNHTPEMRSHAREFHFNFQHTHPATVGFCFDVHWVYRGGIPPLEALAQYGNRVVSWHLRQSRDGLWWEDLDTGDIDYAAIARYAKSHHLPPIYSVELALEKGTQITRSVVENHRRSREFVRKVFGGSP